MHNPIHENEKKKRKKKKRKDHFAAVFSLSAQFNN
jgi:hypothetical protein